MDILKQLITQLTELWSRWDRMQRVGIVTAVCLCLVGCVVISMWASSKEFVTLTNNLTPTQAHEIVSTLQSEGIEYELNFSGSAVAVPVNDLSRSKIAIKQLGHDVTEADADDGGWWADPAQQRSREQRAQERRLAASIQQMQSVRTATVHITRTESSPFIRDQTPTKASVVLQLIPGATVSGTDAQAIVSLVSHAVENLDPENTMIVDTDGRVLSSHDAIGGDVTGQLDFRRRLESGLSSKAEAMLSPILGHGRAVVRVTADVDFTEKNTARTSYDPEGKAKTRESISTETTRGGGQQSGATGTTSNVAALSGSATQGAESDIETIDTEFENTTIVDTIREAPGTILRLTVAAVVELPEPELDEDGNPVANAKATAAITKEQVEKIIQQAVGFDPSRGDEIEVLAAHMTGVPELEATGGLVTWMEQAAPFAKSASLGLASIIALFLGLKLIGRLKPVVVEVERRESIDPEVRARLADLSEEILQHPEAVSTVLAGWLSDRDDSAADSKTPKRKAA